MKLSLKVLRFFASRKLAVYLLAVVAITAAATQIPFFLEKGLDKAVFSSWWYNGLLLLQLLNTLVCSLFRLKELDKKRFRNPGELVKYPNYLLVESTDVGQLRLFIKELLRRKGYKIFYVQHNCFLACKGDSYYWGSMVFHLSFIVILVGLILNNLFGFHGTMIVPEQQIVNEDHKSYQSIKEGILFGEQHQRFQIGVENMNISFDRGKTTASVMEAKVWLMEGHSRLLANQMVKPNQPVKYKGRRILLTGYGYSPNFTLEHEGKVIFQNNVNLMTAWTKDGQIEYKDSFLIPNSKIKVKVQLFPHASITADGKLTNISHNLELPAVMVNVVQQDKELFTGYALMGQTMKLSNGMKLNFQGVKRYGWFDVDYNPGVYFLYGGFLLCLLGLIFALFLTPKKIWVSMGSAGVEIAGCSKRYHQLFREEFNGFAALFSQEEAVKDEIIDDI